MGMGGSNGYSSMGGGKGGGSSYGYGGNIGSGIQNWQRNVYGGSRPWMGDSMGSARPWMAESRPAMSMPQKGGGKGGFGMPNRAMGPAGAYTPTASKGGMPGGMQGNMQSGMPGQQYRPFAQPEAMSPTGPVPVNPYAGPGMFGGGNISQDSPVYNPAAPQPTNQPEAPAPKSMGSHYDLASQLFDQYKAGEMGMNEGDLGWLRQRGYLNPVYGPNSEDNMDPTGFQFDLNNAEARKWLQGRNYSF